MYNGDALVNICRSSALMVRPTSLDNVLGLLSLTMQSKGSFSWPPIDVHILRKFDKPMAIILWSLGVFICFVRITSI